MSNNILKSFWVSPESIEILNKIKKIKNIPITKLLEEAINDLKVKYLE